MTQYSWWITGGNGELGTYKSKAAAERAIKELKAKGFLDPKAKFKTVRHELSECPTCHQPAEKDIIEGLGECLRCDHVRGDLD